MKFGPLLLTCINALIRNPMRAMLTVLGIVIGIAAVVAIMEIGNGSKKQIADQMAGLGADVINVFSASTRTAGVSGGMNTRASIYAEDADAIMKECSDTVLTATPVVRASAQVIVGNKNWNPNSIMGGNENYLDIEGWEVASGTAFTKEHVEKSARVCLIGSTIARELFDGQDPIGQDIRIKDVMFTVIGVLATKGADMGGNDKDDCIILPWSSIRTRLKGASNEATISKGGAANSSSVSSTDTFSTSAVDFYPGTGNDLQPYTSAPHPLRTVTVDFVSVKVRDVKTIPQTMDDMAAVLRRQHRLEPGVLDDFNLRDRAQFTKMVTSTADTMSTLLIAVAMISLVVGGVGIMNIMMVSVTERTREIGLRMAVGARPRDIMWQFLLEAVLLCLTGGILGIALGRTISLIVAAKTGLPVESSPAAMLLAVSVSAVIGIVFGWYPAYKASKLDPIDALHHE